MVTDLTQTRPSRKRVLLVYPEIPQGTYWSYSEALRLIGKKSLLPPLGLITVAALLPEESCELRLVDGNVRTLDDADLAWADVVFLSAMIVQKPGFEEAIARARAAGRTVVVGGPYPSTAFEEIEGVDHFVIGEAEVILGRFWEDYLAGRAKRVYGRPVEAQKVERLRAHFGEDIDVEQADHLPDLAEAPLPRFDLLDMDLYKSMAVQSSRGCPIGCEFCDIWRRFGKKPRFKPEDRIAAELEELYRLGWRSSVFVVDDNFIGNRKTTKRVLRRIAEWMDAHGRPFDFYTEVTLSLADDEELLGLMAPAGFDTVFVGIETPSEESLLETRKAINTSRSMAERVAAIQSHGIQISSGFILGFDNDPDNIAPLMVDCIDELGIPIAMVGLLQALPETDLHDRLEREGRLLSKSNGNNTHEFTTNFVPTRPMERLSDDYRYVLRHIYPQDLDSFFHRCRVLRARWPKKPYKNGKIDAFKLKALGRTLLSLPGKPYGWKAARFLLETLLTKPAFFVPAVSLVVQGHHLSEITQQAFEVEQLQSYYQERTAQFALMLQAYRNTVRDLSAWERIGGAWDSGVATGQQALAGFRDASDACVTNATARVQKIYQQVHDSGEVGYASGRQALTALRQAGDERVARAAEHLHHLCQQAYDRGEVGVAAGQDALHAILRAREALLEEGARRRKSLSRSARAVANERYEAFHQDLEAVLHELFQTPELGSVRS